MTRFNCTIFLADKNFCTSRRDNANVTNVYFKARFVEYGCQISIFETFKKRKFLLETLSMSALLNGLRMEYEHND